MKLWEFLAIVSCAILVGYTAGSHNAIGAIVWFVALLAASSSYLRYGRIK